MAAKATPEEVQARKRAAAEERKKAADERKRVREALAEQPERSPGGTVREALAEK